MTQRNWLGVAAVLVAAAALAGCVRAARDTQGFAVLDTGTANASFDATWQAAKGVLRERGLELYTRDKRGVFVAYTKSKHQSLAHKRMEYTVTLEAVSDTETKVSIESVRQAYGVTLLTYPGWRDRKTTDHKDAPAILEAIQAKVKGA